MFLLLRRIQSSRQTNFEEYISTNLTYCRQSYQFSARCFMFIFNFIDSYESIFMGVSVGFCVCVCVNVNYQNLETNLYSVTRNQCPSLEEKTQIHCIKQTTTKFFTSKQPFHSTPGRRRVQVLDARASSCPGPVCSVGG